MRRAAGYIDRRDDRPPVGHGYVGPAVPRDESDDEIRTDAVDAILLKHGMANFVRKGIRGGRATIPVRGSSESKSARGRPEQN